MPHTFLLASGASPCFNIMFSIFITCHWQSSCSPTGWIAGSWLSEWMNPQSFGGNSFWNKEFSKEKEQTRGTPWLDLTDRKRKSLGRSQHWVTPEKRVFQLEFWVSARPLAGRCGIPEQDCDESLAEAKLENHELHTTPTHNPST